ncbi:MAG TPA: class I SAM-dependent methyltransferase [Polyangiaceae bacterium]|jgi:SAM-dependent methyltransferase
MKLVGAPEFFEAIARRYDRAYALGGEQTRARMAPVLSALPAPPAKVLDLGVGTGRELGALQDAGYSPVGLDVSPTMLELCARRARPVPLVQADLWVPLPFEDASFDAAISLHGTLAHPPAREAYAPLARELARVLRPGGVFVAEVPSAEWLAHAADDGSEGRLVPIAPGRTVHEDQVAGVAIEIIALTPGEWAAAFEPDFDVTCHPLDERETRVIARRRA